MQAAVTSRLKIMGELDIAERRSPQDGRVSVSFAGQPMDLRMAVLPTTYGEKVILRIMPGARRAARSHGARHEPRRRGYVPARDRAALRRRAHLRPDRHRQDDHALRGAPPAQRAERVLTTIEDPVEFQFPGITQVEVNPKSGLTFGRGLRTILRADPDVLLVGEIRDEETARIAIQAALTGHLVLSTLHAHNAASSIARLKDMGVEPNLLATSINCIVAQRLARRLCIECREPYDADRGRPRRSSPARPVRVSSTAPRGCRGAPTRATAAGSRSTR